METFTWSAQVGAQGETSYRVRRAQFGDGYEQVAGDGINNETQSWPLTFKGKTSAIQPIRDFLRRHEGRKTFLWTPPMGELGLYRCESFRLIPHGAGVYSLTATFEQAYHP